MFLTRINRSPLADLHVATSSLNRLFDEALRGWPEYAPGMGIEEDTNDLRLTADLPGVKPENLKISMENNVLSIEATREGRGSYQRSFTVPSTVDAERIQATLEHGVLTVTLPKAEAAKPRHIPVKAQA